MSTEQLFRGGRLLLKMIPELRPASNAGDPGVPAGNLGGGTGRVAETDRGWFDAVADKYLASIPLVVLRRPRTWWVRYFSWKGPAVRDSRVTMIYEGTNEIQAIDLLVRKVLPDRGRAMSALLEKLGAGMDQSKPFEAEMVASCTRLNSLTESLSAPRKSMLSLRIRWRGNT